MTVYAIAQISITDPDRYNLYLARFMDVFKQFKGSLLAADSEPDVVEGTWQHEKMILLSFPDAQAFHAWAQSPDYRRIAIDRQAGSHGVVILARGLG